MIRGNSSPFLPIIEFFLFGWLLKKVRYSCLFFFTFSFCLFPTDIRWKLIEWITKSALNCCVIKTSRNLIRLKWSLSFSPTATIDWCKLRVACLFLDDSDLFITPPPKTRMDLWNLMSERKALKATKLIHRQITLMAGERIWKRLFSLRYPWRYLFCLFVKNKKKDSGSFIILAENRNLYIFSSPFFILLFHST